ncbi:MAG TPA: FHA domain-containing protein [Spirochaetia bacterium]|nr:FHA domain-containing protein [Spirochaetia bacterium]
MTTVTSRFIFLALGFLGGLAAWPAAEVILSFQGGFPSYLAFLTLLGAVVGALMGAFFGAAEGITSRIKKRIPSGLLLGALVGCVGGALGALVGQAALWLIGGVFLLSYRNMQWVVLPVSRAIGWAVLGVFVGAGEGVRALSPKKIAVGVLGGVLGGIVGGFALEYSRLLLPGFAFFRLVGFVILGLAIGLFYGLIEQGMSFGVLRILAGELKGKEFLLSERRVRIGRSPRNEIALPSYDDLADLQADIRVKKGEPVITNLDDRVAMLINEEKTQERRLKLGDVIKIGSARIFYKYG